MLRIGECHWGLLFLLSNTIWITLWDFRKIHVRLHCNLHIFVSELWLWLHMSLGGVKWMIAMGFTFAIPLIKVHDVVQEIGGSSLTCFGNLFWWIVSSESEHIIYIGFWTLKMGMCSNWVLRTSGLQECKSNIFLKSGGRARIPSRGRIEQSRDPCDRGGR